MSFPIPNRRSHPPGHFFQLESCTTWKVIWLVLVIWGLTGAGCSDRDSVDCPQDKSDLYFTAKINNQTFEAQSSEIYCTWEPPVLVLQAYSSNNPDEPVEAFELQMLDYRGQTQFFYFNDQANFAFYINENLVQYNTEPNLGGQIEITRFSDCYVEGRFFFQARGDLIGDVIAIQEGTFRALIE